MDEPHNALIQLPLAFVMVRIWKHDEIFSYFYSEFDVLEFLRNCPSEQFKAHFQMEEQSFILDGMPRLDLYEMTFLLYLLTSCKYLNGYTATDEMRLPGVTFYINLHADDFHAPTKNPLIKLVQQLALFEDNAQEKIVGYELIPKASGWKYGFISGRVRELRSRMIWKPPNTSTVRWMNKAGGKYKPKMRCSYFSIV